MGDRKPGREEVDRLKACSGCVGKVGVKWLAQPVKMNWSRSNKAQKSGWCWSTKMGRDSRCKFIQRMDVKGVENEAGSGRP